MKIKHIILLIAGFLPSVLFAQLHDVVAASGGSMTSGGKNLSFTLGEVMVTTLTTATVSLTQGFQQPGIIVTGTDEGVPGLQVEAWPNPVRTAVHLAAAPGLLLHYKLFDMNGILVDQNALVEAETDISFEDLPPAVYLLKVYKDLLEIKTFRIVKR